MKTVEVIGYKRANLGKSNSKQLRAEGNAPCVLYGGKEQIHFYSPMYLFKEIVYSPEVAFVKLNIEGEIYNAILQDVHFHPVSEMILHADFIQLFDDKPIKMDIPVKFTGKSPGIQAGGKLVQKLRKVTLRALPANMPDEIVVSIQGLRLGKSIKVADIKEENFEILNSKLVSLATIAIPRALRGVGDAIEEEEAGVEAEGGDASEAEKEEASE